MILSPEYQPAPANEDSDLETQVKDIFGPEGLLSKANNFEYRPPPTIHGHGGNPGPGGW